MDAAEAGMFLLLRQAFTSSRDAGIVMLNLPLALVGGVIGRWVTGGVRAQHAGLPAIYLRIAQGGWRPDAAAPVAV